VTPSTTVSIIPPTAEATTGTPQAIASSGTMPNGSYHGAQTTTSAERSNAGSSLRSIAPAQVDAVGDAGRLRHAEQTRASGSVEQLGAWRSAGDDELGVGQAGESLDHVADALALDHPPDAQQPPQSRATRIARAIGTEELEIHSAGDHGELVPGGAEAQQLEDLVGAGGHDLIGAAHDVALDREALGREVSLSPW
jgi:hypothetical protein